MTEKEQIEQELKDLEERIKKLFQFIAPNAGFDTLKKIDQDLLYEQHKTMCHYADVLRSRLFIWEERVE